MPTTAPSSPSTANTLSLPSGLQNIPASTPWATALLDELGAPQTAANYAFLNGWFAREHSASDIQNHTMYANNPFFTTAGGGGTVGKFKAGMYPTVNSKGVTYFPSVSVGVLATAVHISSEYPNIFAALKSGNPAAYSTGPNGSNFSSDLLRWSGSSYTGFANGPSVPYGPALGQNTPAGIIGAGDQGSQGPIGQIGGAVGSVTGAVGGAVNAAEATGKFLGELSNPYLWLRIAEVVGGVLLIGLGLYLIAKDMGLAPPKPPGPLGKAADESAELAAAFEQGQRQGRTAQARAAGRRSAGAVVTGSETPRSQRYTRIREQARQIPDEIPF